MNKLLAIALAVALPATVYAQDLEQTLEKLDAAAEWQPSWRFVSGVFALGGGAALLSLSFAYGDRVLHIEDRALAASDAAESATTEAELIRLRNRVDSLNQRGNDLETRHLATLAGGAVLFAVGLALVIWDRMRESDLAISVAPSFGGVAVTMGW